MAEDIIIRYRAEVDELVKELNLVIEQQEKVADSADKSAKTFQKSVDSETKAAQRRADAIKSELANIEKLKASRARAFDPVVIDRFNRAISQSEARIKSLSSATDKEAKKLVSSFDKAGSQIKNIGLGIAAGFGAAFTVDAVIQFARASVNAFIDAEKNANKLKFAITQIGGESEQAFNRLIKQSGELQKITIFSDDAIQQAQSALSAFGLTADQIEDLIPKLADFATVTGQDIVSAAQQVGAGLEGAGREFKKYGIEVSATASRQDNFNKILEGFGKFAGSAEEATKTLSGELELLRNEADDLQESIGEKLAPVFVKARKAFLSFVSDVVDGFATLNGVNQEATERSQQRAEDALDKTIEGIKASVDVYVKAGKASLEATKLVVEREKELLQEEISRNIGIDEDYASEKIAINKFILKNLDKYVDDLAKNADKQAQISEELTEGEKKLKDVRIAGTEEEIKAMRELMDSYQFLSEDQKRLVDLSVLSTEGIETLTLAVKQLNEEFQSDAIKDFEDKLKGLNDARLKSTEGFKQATVDTRTELEKFLDANLVAIQASQDLFSQLTSLYNTFADDRIRQLERQGEAFTENLTAEDEALNESREQRLISEADYRKRSDAIEAKKVENEKRIQAAINKERRKAAILEKINATFEIILNTAVAISKASPNPILIALAAALGAAQLATVAATPLPAFKKGTKGKKGSGMALVGEEGAEMTYLPDGAKVLPAKQTKTYGEVFDAMFDNRFESYVLKKYVAPALAEQKRKFDEGKEKNFASNIVTSMQYNGLTTGDLIYANRKGTNIRNTDEIAIAIAKALKTERPDLWRL